MLLKKSGRFPGSYLSGGTPNERWSATGVDGETAEIAFRSIRMDAALTSPGGGENPPLKLLAFLAAILLLPLFVAGVLVWRDDPLSATERSANPFLSSPTPRTITDERQVRIVAAAIPGPEVAAGLARGTITAVGVAPDDTLVDGAVLFQVDGIDRIGFASSLPFYRPLASGAVGADVAQLHRMLLVFGFLDVEPANPSQANFTTGQAIAAFAESIGAERTTTFDPSWVVFLPEAGLIAESVNLKVGLQAPPQGTVLVTTPGRVTSARLVSGNQEPLNFAPGAEYVAIVDSEEFAIDTSTQAIAEADLPRLRSPKETERDGIPALARRKVPLQALAVPSSSVMTNDRGALCLWLPEDKAYRAVTVTIASARGGVTNVATGLEASQQVLANPAQVLDDPQCP